MSFHLLLLQCHLCNNKNPGRHPNKKAKERTLCSCKFLCLCKASVTCFSAFFSSLSSSCSAWLVRSSWISSSRFSFPSNICSKSNQKEPCKLASPVRGTRTHAGTGEALGNSGFGSAFSTEQGCRASSSALFFEKKLT